MQHDRDRVVPSPRADQGAAGHDAHDPEPMSADVHQVAEMNRIDRQEHLAAGSERGVSRGVVGSRVLSNPRAYPGSGADPRNQHSKGLPTGRPFRFPLSAHPAVGEARHSPDGPGAAPPSAHLPMSRASPRTRPYIVDASSCCCSAKIEL